MLVSSLKSMLNQDDVIAVLESLGCEQIKVRGNYITSTRANNSDNPCGVIIYTDKDYHALMPTDTAFQKEPYKDIITVVQIIKNISFPQAIHYICNICGYDFYQNHIEEKPKALSWLDQIEQTGCYKEKQQIVLPDQLLKQFIPYLHSVWVDEGITISTAKEFEIAYDVQSNSIAIPMRDEIGSLLGVQARSLDENPTSKYWYIYPFQKKDILYGFYQNYQSIKEKKQVIVFEGAKSVLQAYSNGIKNTVALLGKTISPQQIDILNRTGAEIILALDHDVAIDQIENIEREINRYVILNDVSVLKDELGMFLKDKESPTDNMEFLKNYEAFKYTLAKKE